MQQVRNRVYYLDWLRVIGMIWVFCFHVGRVYDVAGWQVKNPEGSYAITLFTGFAIQWIMPLFFLLAGASSYLALARTTKMPYIRERLKRLIIPFVCGLFILIPPQEYVQQLGEGRYNGTFIKFYPHFLDGMHPEFNFRWFFAYSHNLWFLGFLFIFSLISLPVFSLIATKKAKDFVSKLSEIGQKPFGMFVFIVPIAVVQVLLRAGYNEYLDWADFFFWFLIFIYGYIIQSNKSYETAVVKNRFLALAVGVVCTIIMAFLLADGYIELWELSPKFTLGFAFYQILKSISTWSWVVFLLGIGIKHLQHSNAMLVYANEAALPFYMVHQTVLFIAAYYITKMPITIFSKFILTLIATFLVTVIVYDLFIRRTNITRFMFGLKKLKDNSIRLNKNISADG